MEINAHKILSTHRISVKTNRRKNGTVDQLFQKRILRMAVVLLLISIPYYYVFLRSEGISILNFLTYIYGHSATTALW